MKIVFKYIAIPFLISVIISGNIHAQTNPFKLKSTGITYTTLQEAINAATSGETIIVATNASGWDATTYSTDNPTSYYDAYWGGEVLIDKSVTITSENPGNPSPLIDFVFYVVGNHDIQPDIKFEGLNLTGKSKFIVYTGNSSDKKRDIDSLVIRNCYIDVNGGIPSVSQRPNPFNYPLHKYNGATFTNYTDKASIIFNSFAGAGDIKSFYFVGNTWLNQGNRYIAGRGFFRNLEISDNIIGSNSCRFGSMFLTAEDSGYSSESFTYRIHDNVFYANNTAYLLWFTTGYFGNTEVNNVYVNDNSIDYLPEGRPSGQNLVYATKLYDIKGGKTTITTYDNDVNGYCFNKIYVDGANEEHFVANQQPGHSYKHVANVPYGYTKAEDEIYHNVASSYNPATGIFTEYDLGTAKYCTCCDELIVSLITITKSGLKTGESAVFSIYDKNVPENNINVLLTGVDNEGTMVSQTVTALLGTNNVTVKEQSWSWAYTPEGDIEKTQDITQEGGNVFTFANEAKDKTPLHSEAVMNNSVIGYEQGSIIVDVEAWKNGGKKKIKF